MRFSLLAILQFLTLPFLSAQTTEAPAAVVGTVTDASNRQPVAYATITCSDCVNGGTITNADGKFEVYPNVNTVTLKVSHILYENRELNVNPSPDELAISLVPARIDLPGVEVNGRKGQDILLKAIAKLRSEANQLYTGRGYYRQTSRLDGVYNTLLESFVDVGLNSAGIQRWETKTGRYGISPSDGSVRMINFSMFTRAIRTNKEGWKENQIVYPLNVSTHRFYAIDVEKYLTTQNGRTLAVIRCRPDGDAPSDSYTATVYIDTTTFDMPQFEISGVGAVSFPNLDDGAEINEAGPHEMTCRLKRSADGAAQLLSSVTSRISFFAKIASGGASKKNEITSTFLVLETKPTRRLKKDPKENPNDYERIFKAKYKPRFWRKYPVMTNSPLEERMILDFEKKGFFGTVSFE